MEFKPLTAKELEFLGYGSHTTISKYVAMGMPRHGVRGRYWFIEEEVRNWILCRGEPIYIACPCCGKMIKVPKEVILNAKHSKDGENA